ncbi:MAG: hypothetical protein M3O29_04205, partial [Actinomycetota bacterium]|nr:hypothetical protein [Actinomycetota bacterium]
ARTAPRDLLGAFVTRFAAIYRATDPPMAERVRAAWLPVAGTIGEIVRATTVDGTTVVGSAERIDDDGALVVVTDEGLARVGFGDVEHLRGA